MSKIMLDKEREIRLPFSVMKQYKAVKGKSVFLVFDECSKNPLDPPIDELSYILWLCLKLDDPGITEEQVDNIVNLANFENILDALTDGKNVESSSPLSSGGPGQS